jgi:hypothetical protein
MEGFYIHHPNEYVSSITSQRYITVYFKEAGQKGINWINLAQDRVQWKALMNRATNLCIPNKLGNFLSSCATISSSRTLLHGVD